VKVFGATGYIGGSVVKRLVVSGHEVLGLASDVIESPSLEQRR
jgi:uncharacterized protein YbjT (DUF2867 family)